MKNLKKHLAVSMLAVLGSLPQAASAESNTTTGVSPSAEAHLDFRITIPGILRFQVGSAGSVDIIDFAPPATTLGDDSNTQGTGGDQGNGVVTVDLFSNAGQVTITEENSGSSNGLNNGTVGENIPYSEIITTSGDPTNFAAPALSNSDKNTSLPKPTSGNDKVTSRSTTWSYAYDNKNVYPAGIYGGVNTQGGRVKYTAATP